jgi:uncharacterized protein YjbI with pentapeptide repeats
MQKIVTVLGALLVPLATSAFAEDSVPAAAPASVCADWKSNVNIDTKALDKLNKSVSGDKPDKGLSYTKEQFVVLLGKNLARAKETLANAKDKLPKTSEGKVDLKDVALNGFYLAGLNLDNVDFKGAEMNGADLSGSSLVGASLVKTELTGANLNNTNLSYATLSKTKFNEASLCHATLTSADLEGATFGGAYLKDAKFDMAKNLPKVIYQNSQNVLLFGLAVPAD